jgi:hypothetical protein
VVCDSVALGRSIRGLGPSPLGRLKSADYRRSKRTSFSHIRLYPELRIFLSKDRRSDVLAVLDRCCCPPDILVHQRIQSRSGGIQWWIPDCQKRRKRESQWSPARHWFGVYTSQGSSRDRMCWYRSYARRLPVCRRYFHHLEPDRLHQRRRVCRCLFRLNQPCCPRIEAVISERVGR